MRDAALPIMGKPTSWLEIQFATDDVDVPSASDFECWASKVFDYLQVPVGSVVVRLVNEVEMQALNREYRNIDKPTNVLSFSLSDPVTDSFLDEPLLGDIVICVPIVLSEANKQHKQWLAHWAHMLVHGLLHLLGYDHEEIIQADEMESLETSLLQQLGFPPPYLDLSI